MFHTFIHYPTTHIHKHTHKQMKNSKNPTKSQKLESFHNFTHISSKYIHSYHTLNSHREASASVSHVFSSPNIYLIQMSSSQPLNSSSTRPPISVSFFFKHSTNILLNSPLHAHSCHLRKPHTPVFLQKITTSHQLNS